MDSTPNSPLEPLEQVPPTREADERGGNARTGRAAAPLRGLRIWFYILVAIGALILGNRELARSIAVFVVTLGILVFVHEWGHYQFARWAGMKVNRFGIGFPPWIYNRHYKGIDYSIGALPIGGMVDIAGLGSEEEMLATAQGAEFATHTSRANIPHGQRQFQDATLGWRFWTLFAGPLMNFLFAIVVFVGIYSFVGVPTLADDATLNRIDTLVPGDPADKAGLKVGDYVIGINDVKTTNNKKLTVLIRTSGGQAIKVLIKRGQQVLTKTVQPVMKNDLVKVDNSGLERAPAIGVSFYVDQSKFHYEKIGVVNGIKAGCYQAFGIANEILHLVGRAATFKLSKGERAGIGGPVKIAQVAGEAAKQGWQESVLLAAGLSINLGLINLLPLPALDGGRILFLGYELVARRPVDPKKEGIVHMVGMVMLLAFMAFITMRDIYPWLSQHLGKVF